LPALPSLAEVDDESVGLDSKASETVGNSEVQCSWCLPSLSQVSFTPYHHHAFGTLTWWIISKSVQTGLKFLLWILTQRLV